MALTNANLAMIKALAGNDLHGAKRQAIASLIEDKTQKNREAVKRYKKLLTSHGSTLMDDLPNDLKTVLVGEVPSGFEPERYYVRPSEQKVVDGIIRMKLIAEEMSNRRIPYKNATLLYGGSGTGKTELGRYTAYKLNLPFFYISFVSTIDSYMGSTAKNMHRVFDFCSTVPCVLMLDEIDCIATRRCAGGSRGPDGELERTTISLMQELDRLPNHVALIAATNRIDMVDEAVLRRFSVKHEVLPMTEADLIALAKKFVGATDTEKYVNPLIIGDMVKGLKNPGQLMPELISYIGEGIYEENKDSLIKAAEEEERTCTGLWEVTYTWKKHVIAETEEDAIAEGRKQRMSYTSGLDVKETYSATESVSV